MPFKLRFLPARTDERETDQIKERGQSVKVTTCHAAAADESFTL